jgi:hypothetical protein
MRFLSQNTSVGLVTGYGLGGRVSIPGSARDFLLFSLQRTEQLWGSTQPPIHEREIDHTLPSSAEVKNGGTVPPHSHTSSSLGV